MSRSPRRPRNPGVSVQLGGESWRIVSKRMRSDWGLADFDDKIISIDPRTREVGREREIVIHECLHALFPHLDEAVILAAGKELDDALEAMGL